MRVSLFIYLFFFTVNSYADYTIDYGDGNSSVISATPWVTGQHINIAAHAYTADGFYTVIVTADVDCNGDGNADASQVVGSIQVRVGNVKQQWDYGDGQRSSSTEDPCTTPLTAQSHAYDEIGEYTVTYTALGTDGGITVDTMLVNVGSGGGTEDELAENFNCIERGALDEKANIKQVYTKLAGIEFNLDIVALDDNGEVNDKYKKTVSVELINQLNGSTVASDLSFEFKGGDKGRKAYSVNLSQAYKNLVCKVTYISSKKSKGKKDKTGDEIITESSDSFSVRPLSFSSISSSMNNTTSAAGVTAKAGADLFSITASTGVTSYTGTPKYNNLLKDHNDSDQENKLSGNFSAANEPSLDARGTNFQYQEVGLLKFSINDIYDDSFTAVDQTNDCTDDFSNVLVNGKYGCKFGNVDEFVIGRFVPDHFTLLSSSITPTCNGFTYMDQVFAVSYQIEAKNGLNEVTKNYHYSSSNNYAKTSEIVFVAESSSPSNDLSDRLSTLYDTTLWINGSYQANNSDILFSRAPSADGAYDDLNLGLKVVDTDGVLLADLDMLAADNSNANCAPAACFEKNIGTTNIRFGRLTMDNAHGSELIALSSPVYTEYFNNSGFVTNTEDSCTAINLSQFSFNGSVNPIAVASGHSTASIVNTPISAGQIDLAFTAPGTGNTGAIDINVNSLFEWLRFDWDGDGNNDDFPTARVTFGIYKGNQKQIYFREVY